jgi:hypothetical protein
MTGVTAGPRLGTVFNVFNRANSKVDAQASVRYHFTPAETLLGA